MRKNEKHAKKRTAKYKPRNKVITTKDPKEREAFYASTDTEAPLGTYQLAAGAIQHPRTKLWQVWLSTNGLDLNHMSAHHDKAKAETDVAAIKHFAQTPDIYDPGKCTTFFSQLAEAGDAEPEPLPDELVRHIGRTILHGVIDFQKPNP